LAPCFISVLAQRYTATFPPMDAMTLGQRLAQCLCVGWGITQWAKGAAAQGPQSRGAPKAKTKIFT